MPGKHEEPLDDGNDLPVRPNNNAARFAADRDRQVDVTVNIPGGKLPNRIFTTPLSIITAIIHRAELPNGSFAAMFAICRKFFLAQRDFEQYSYLERECFISGAVSSVTLYNGRLFVDKDVMLTELSHTAHNTEKYRLRLVRLPRIDQLWHGGGSWFIETYRGLYAWGDNDEGCLGVGHWGYVSAPQRVNIQGPVLGVFPFNEVCFFRTPTGWYGSGFTEMGELGCREAPQGTRFASPLRLPNTEGVIRWYSNSSTTFAWTSAGLMACGPNHNGCAGVGSTEEAIGRLTPVVLPTGVKSNVHRVVSADESTFIISGHRCFVCGDNSRGQLGVPLTGGAETIDTPVELPFPVLNVISADERTVFLSDGQLLVCGNNSCDEFFLTDPEATEAAAALGVEVPAPISGPTPPTPLALPAPVDRVFIMETDSSGQQYMPFIFVRCDDDSWFGCGNIDAVQPGVLVQVLGAERLVTDGQTITCWRRASPVVRRRLEGLGRGSSFMVIDVPVPVHPDLGLFKL